MLGLAVWRVILAGLWLIVILDAAVVTRLDPDLQLCKTASVVKDEITSVETTTDANGNVTSETTTKVPMSKEATETCEPLGVAEFAVLLLPSLILISPVLKGFNIAGLFGFDFRDFKEEVVSETQEKVIRVVIEREVGAKTERAVNQIGEGKLSDLPDV